MIQPRLGRPAERGGGGGGGSGCGGGGGGGRGRGGGRGYHGWLLRKVAMATIPRAQPRFANMIPNSDKANWEMATSQPGF